MPNNNRLRSSQSKIEITFLNILNIDKFFMRRLAQKKTLHGGMFAIGISRVIVRECLLFEVYLYC